MNRTGKIQVILALIIGALTVCHTSSGQNFIRLVQEEDMYSGDVYNDSLLVRVPFPHAVSSLPNYPKINIAAIEYMQMLEDPDIELLEVYVCGSTSPEGLWGDNVKLGQARADNVARYIQYALDIPEHKIHKENIVEDWDRLADMIEDSDLPYKYEALHIIRTMDWGERKTALRRLGGGKVWKILERDYFPELRSVRFGIFCGVKPQPMAPRIDTVYVRDTVIIREIVRETPPAVIEQPVETRVKEEPVPEPSSGRKKKSSGDNAGNSKPERRMGIKTNLVSDAIAVPQLGIEFQLGNRISLNIEGWYTPFNIFVPSDKNTNIYGFRPQLRLWFGKETMKRGSYIAVNGGCMWYTMQWKDGLLYQNGKQDQYNTNAGNSSPAWSAGFSYGYSLGFGKKRAWGLEFELGIGYEHTSQNIGRLNEISGKWEIYDYQSKQRVGLTHANINLTYRFSMRKKNS